jgi:flavin reductase (DIM6/NTAB) family NADH-FMN oxidoreductase RutF
MSDPVLTPPVGETLRQIMRGVAATVTLVTTEVDDLPYGMTATSFTSLCLDPPSILVAVNREASLHDPLLVRGLFAVNVLPEGAELLARRFGDSRLDNAERFTHGSWRRHATGMPLLEGAQACLVCRLGERLAVGTHTLVVGRVEEALLVPRVAPLLYADGRYLGLPAA